MKDLAAFRRWDNMIDQMPEGSAQREHMRNAADDIFKNRSGKIVWAADQDDLVSLVLLLHKAGLIKVKNKKQLFAQVALHFTDPHVSDFSPAYMARRPIQGKIQRRFQRPLQADD